jgi:competence protein ComEA
MMEMKKIVAAAAMWLALGASAAVDVNQAGDAELNGVKGVGPALSKRIVEARAQGAFKDWADFMARVKGVKEKSAAKLSAEGLTVNGKSFGAATAPAPVVAAGNPTPASAAPKKGAAKP